MLKSLLTIQYQQKNTKKEAGFLASNHFVNGKKLELDFFNSAEELKIWLQHKTSSCQVTYFLKGLKYSFPLKLVNYNSTLDLDGLPVLQTVFELDLNENEQKQWKLFIHKTKNENRRHYYPLILLFLLASAFLAWFWQKNLDLVDKNKISQTEIRILEKRLRDSYEEKIEIEKKLFAETKANLEQEVETLKEGMKKLKFQFKEILTSKEDELKKIEEQIKEKSKEIEVKQRREEAMNQFVGHLEERLFYFSVTSDSENLLISGPADRSVLEDENYSKAKKLEQAKQYQASIPLFEKVAKDHPYSRWAYSGLARALYRTNQMSEARKVFASYIRIMRVDYFRKLGFKMEY